ncbi:MAG: hypothetical protein ACXWW9_06310 [Actinomycetota bacterium]
MIGGRQIRATVGVAAGFDTAEQAVEVATDVVVSVSEGKDGFLLETYIHCETETVLTFGGQPRHTTPETTFLAPTSTTRPWASGEMFRTLEPVDIHIAEAAYD